MTPRQASVRARVDAARSSVYRDLLIALGGIAGAVIPVLLLIGWMLADVTGWGAPSAAPLLLDLAALAAAILLVRFGLRRWLSRATPAQIASAAESELGLPEGSVRGVLELADAAPNGTSHALARYAEAALMPHVSNADARQIAGDLGRAARRRRGRATAAFAVLSVAVVIAAFVSPDRSRAGWSPLLNPVSHLTPPPLPPLVIEPGNVEVARGAALDVRVRAPGREAVLLQWRAEGDVLHSEPVTIGDGSGAAQIPSIDSPMRYWVRAPDGAISDTFRVTPVDPLLVSDLAIEIVYPSYIGRPTERFEGELPSLEVPEGTQLIIRGRATRPLASAQLLHDSAKSQVTFNIEDAQFSGRWIPTVSGTYVWAFTGQSGKRAELAPAPFELTVVPDAPPSVAITFPGGDTILGPELMQSIVADASDDHGIFTATLVSWKTSATGVREKDVAIPVAIEGEATRAIVRGMLDARVRNLMPGDTLSYYVRITDNSPRRQTAVSETYTLRLPSVEELRENSADETNRLLEEMDKLARQAEELEKLTRDLNRRAASEARRNASGRGNGSPGGKTMDFEQAEQARQVLERQEKVTEEAARISRQLDAIQRAIESAGLQDPEIQQRLEEMRELYQKLVTPELQAQMEQLRQALEKLDAEEVRRQMEALAKQQEQFREQLERSLEMMRRAAAEQELNALSQQAKELATQQQAVSEQMKQDGKEAEQAAETQKEIQEKTNRLAEALARLQQKLSQQGMTGPAQKTGKAGDQAKEAGEDMKRAAQQAENRQGEQAAQSGQQAAEKLNQTAQSLEDTRREMAESWNREAQEAMDQATSDALNLAQKQNELLQRMQAQVNKEGGKGEESEQAEGQKLPKPNMPQSGNQQQDGQKQGGQKGGAQQQAGQQGGQQKGGQQQGGQQQGGKQQGGQQQGGQQQGGKQQDGQQGKQGGEDGRQGDGQRGGQGGEQSGQSQGNQRGNPQGGSAAGDRGDNEAASIRAEQQALKQGLQQLGQNLTELSKQAGTMNREVGAALGRANLSMEQTLRALEEGRMPIQEAQKTLEDLNRLALALVNSSQQQGQGQGNGLDETIKQLQDLAKKQGSINGQTSALAPLNLGQQAMADPMNRLAREQREVAQKLGGMNNIGGREDVLGQLDELAKEAEELARELAGGRLTPETMARQERLFHKLLDAGRTLEKDEYSDERKAERPGNVAPSRAGALKAELLDSSERYPAPTAEQLKNVSPAMRRLILEYYDRLNRAPVVTPQRRESTGR